MWERNGYASCIGTDAERTRMAKLPASILKASQPFLGILNLGMV
jgi:hypothetical protein